jgi:hypothetical protein
MTRAVSPWRGVSAPFWPKQHLNAGFSRLTPKFSCMRARLGKTIAKPFLHPSFAGFSPAGATPKFLPLSGYNKKCICTYLLTKTEGEMKWQNCSLSNS